MKTKHFAGGVGVAIGLVCGVTWVVMGWRGKAPPYLTSFIAAGLLAAMFTFALALSFATLGWFFASKYRLSSLLILSTVCCASFALVGQMPLAWALGIIVVLFLVSAAAICLCVDTAINNFSQTIRPILQRAPSERRFRLHLIVGGAAAATLFVAAHLYDVMVLGLKSGEFFRMLILCSVAGTLIGGVSWLRFMVAFRCPRQQRHPAGGR